jgi:hypothetical protein
MKALVKALLNATSDWKLKRLMNRCKFAPQSALKQPSNKQAPTLTLIICGALDDQWLDKHACSPQCAAENNTFVNVKKTAEAQSHKTGERQEVLARAS